ncbi:MAG: SH3 domain-containing protein [Chloroflexota bacterium]|nr:SH3 domain-containing protein [Chloroflexota bacterium]
METRGAYSRRRFLLGATGVAMVALTPALVTPATARSTDTRIVNTSGARLRSGPRTGYSVVASLAKGTEVRYLAYGGSANGYEWHKVMVLSSGKQGFIAASLLSVPGSSGGNTGGYAIGASFWAKVANANLRSGAGTSYGVIKVLPQGSQGTVIDGTVAANGYT